MVEIGFPEPGERGQLISFPRMTRVNRHCISMIIIEIYEQRHLHT